MHPPGANFPHRGYAFGLTRFACLGTGLFLSPWTANSRGPAAERRPGGAAQGVGGGTPHAVERLRRGRDAGGEQKAAGRHCRYSTPCGGLIFGITNDFAK